MVYQPVKKAGSGQPPAIRSAKQTEEPFSDWLPADLRDKSGALNSTIIYPPRGLCSERRSLDRKFFASSLPVCSV